MSYPSTRPVGLPPAPTQRPSKRSPHYWEHVYQSFRRAPNAQTRWRLCWSHCTMDCLSREYGTCRREIPEHELPPPNEGVDHLCDLQWGLRDYDEERAAYSLALHRWYREDREGPKPTHWRKLVRDPHAGFRIWEDPDQRDGYEQVKLFNPYHLHAYFLNSPFTVRATHAAMQQQANYSAMRHLQMAILKAWRSFLSTEVSSGKTEVLNPKRATGFIEQACDKVAQVLLVSYELYPSDWVPRILEHGSGADSEQWQQMMERVEQRLLEQEQVDNPTPEPESIYLPTPGEPCVFPSTKKRLLSTPVPGFAEEPVEFTTEEADLNTLPPLPRTYPHKDLSIPE